MSKILMVASEAIPFAKTGGLADVVGSLPCALQKLGHEVAVLMPRYRGIELKGSRRVYDNLHIWFGPKKYETCIHLLQEQVPFFFVDCPPLYEREGLYGDTNGDYPDNHVRFAVLAQAVLALARHVFHPDIIHCHDWQSGLVPTYLHSTYANDPTFLDIKTLFTIHNLGYQGLFPADVLPQIGLDRTVFHMNGVEFYGKVSFIKGGLAYSDALNTVSRRYAEEIQTEEYGFGLDGLLRARSAVLSGILNGVDYSEWSPETDRYITANYSVADLSGKAQCKQDLIAEFGLPPEAMQRPLIGVVSRFTRQKGADLIAEVGAKLADEDLYLVAFGSGEPEYEEIFLNLAQAHPGKIAVRIGFNNGLAHKIEAGADIFLMPSRYEPCGLNQIYSLRYGTVPVVRATGGLDDTIEESTGFKFQDYSGKSMLAAIRAACTAYSNKKRWGAMVRRGMEKDFSWNISAAEYSALYGRLTG